MSIKENLEPFYASQGDERVGFILQDGAIVEVENIAVDPAEGFDIATEDLVTFGDLAVATWHTHPDESCNLSANDHQGFLWWPNLLHFIFGKNGLAVYQVSPEGRVVNCDDDADDLLSRAIARKTADANQAGS